MSPILLISGLLFSPVLLSPVANAQDAAVWPPVASAVVPAVVPVVVPAVWPPVAPAVVPAVVPVPAANQPSPWGPGVPAAPVVAPASAAVDATPWMSSLSAVQLIYSGGSHGVGSGRYRFTTLRRMAEAEASGAGTVQQVGTFNGAMAQGPWLLHGSDRQVQTVVAVASSAGVTCDPPQPANAVTAGSGILVVPAGAAQPLISHLTADGPGPTPWQMRTCRAPAGQTATLIGPLDAPLPSWSLDDWEFRKALDVVWTDSLHTTPLTITGLPVQDSARMFSAIEDLRRKHPGALFVDAGSFVDGVSGVRHGHLSLHRPLGFEMLRRLQPAVLAPGETELIAGPVAFITEAAGLPYVVTNWVTTNPAVDLPAFRIVTIDQPSGPVRVAFLGVLDPALQQRIPELGEQGVQLTDPVDGVQPVVDALAALPEPPDAVVVLTTASGEVMADIRRRLRGVDLMAGDPTFATVRVAKREVTLRHLDREQTAAPLTVSLDGLAIADLEFDGDALVGVVAQPVLVRGSLPADPAVSASITRTRAAVYPALDTPLLPAAAGGPLALWKPQQWDQLMCEAVRLESDSHTVLLRDMPPPPVVPGPLTALQTLDALTLLDELVVVRVPGSMLLRVLDRAYSVTPVSCGATSANPKPDGRAIDPLRTYRILTSDRTLHGTALGPVLAGIGVKGPLDPPIRQAVVNSTGQPVTVPASAVRGLEVARASAGSEQGGVTALLQDRPAAVPPLWLFRLTQLSFRVDRFRGVEDDTFGAVPETLATNPSSLTLATAVDVAIENSGIDTIWDLRLRGAYSTLQTDADGADITLAEAETADDIRWSTSLSVPAWSIPLTSSLQAMPYTELLFDTELSPTLDETGAENSKQRDLSLTAGLAARPIGALRTLRAGAFANRDLSRVDEKPTEFGGRFELGTSSRVVGALTWTTLADLQVWAPTAADDESDLRVRALGETRLGMPLARWLAVSAYGQGFAVRGRVPATDKLGTAWTVGAALDLSGAFEL